MSLLAMIAGLNEAGVKYVVIGGVAATAHGSTRVTDDLDICYEQSPENGTALAALLASWQAYPRGIEPGLPFFMDARTLRDSVVLTLTTAQGHLDLLQHVDGVGDFAACRTRSVRIEVGKEEIIVLGLPALIAAKRATGRKKDIEHLYELEALLELQRKRKGKP
jgi:predicted nucleotidyltransferase